MMKHFTYHRPRSLAQAIEISRSVPGARYIAGGTDVMVRLRQENCAQALVSLRGIPGLAGIQQGESLRIGALTTVTDLIQNPEVGIHCALLGEAARLLGSCQIRNVATVGGNLCNASPCADLAPALLVFGASVEAEGPEGRRTIPLESFFVGPAQADLRPHEVLTAVVIERPPRVARTIFLKKGRVAMDLALASVAVGLDLDGRRCIRARVAAGSVAPTPRRLVKVEQVLEGQMITRDLLEQARAAAEEEVLPITDVRATAEYRRHLTGVLVKRGVRALVDPLL